MKMLRHTVSIATDNVLRTVHNLVQIQTPQVQLVQRQLLAQLVQHQHPDQLDQDLQVTLVQQVLPKLELQEQQEQLELPVLVLQEQQLNNTKLPIQKKPALSGFFCV